jgi:GNAT superfamily N-acetyltransferase
LTQVRFVVSSHTEDEKKASSDLITECFDNAMGTAYEKRYNWQFLENPAGTGRILMAYDGEKLIGQIASIPCRYVYMDRHIPTAIAGEWLCVSPKYRGKGIMSELIHRRTKTEENPFPFVLDLPNKASMNGFLKANYYQMPMKLLTRPLKLSKCFAYKKVPRIILKPFDGIWERRGKIDFDEFILEEYSSPIYDGRFDELFNAANNKMMIRQVRNSEFLNWRYGNVPGRSYKTIVSRGEDGRLNGYIIIRLAVAYGISVGFIMDFVTKEDSESGKFLIRYALKYFWNNDAAVAAALCFPNCIEYQLLRKEGFFICPKRIRPNPFILCIKPFHDNQNQFDTTIMMDSNRWYFMFGDFQVF